LRILGTERRAGRHTAAVAACVAPLLLAACATRPNDASTSAGAGHIVPTAGEVVTTQGQAVVREFGPYWWAFVFAIGIFILVEGLLLYITLRYRRRRSDTQLPAQTHGNNPLEILWTAIPALIVLFLFVLSWQTLNEVDARSDSPAVTVDATAFQFYWEFAYPDHPGVKVDGIGQPRGAEMVLPVDETVRIRLHSDNVIHSFYVPRFFYKRDAIPGRTNEFDVRITEPGTYGGQCAEFCGLGHADMFFTVRAVERPEFDAWLAAQEEAARATPTPGPSPTVSGSPAPPSGVVLRIATTADAPLAFTESTLSAPAGTEITVEYLNDSPLQHDIAFFEGPDAGAPRIAQTEVGQGPGNLQTVTFTTPETPGSYFFHCDVHPVQMTGTFEVTP
jgi:cytochrome c oxidase subunit 2